MQDNSIKAPSIETIDAEIAGGFFGLRFREPLERQYESDISESRRRHLTIASIIGLIFYDFFLVSDWRMLPDVFHEALIFRLGIFTPLAAFGIMKIQMSWGMKIADMYAAFIATLSVVLIMSLVGLSESVYRVHYQYGTIMIVVFAAVVQRIAFRYLVVALSGIFTVQLVIISHLGKLDSVLFQHVALTFATITILVAFAAYGLEREARRSYLLSVRSRLMNDELDRSAKIDPLTGLWNRRHLNATMEAAWACADVSPRVMTIILLDIDHFKTFNDNYGHMDGDRCLQRIGTRVQSALDDFERISVRFGGEEFLIFLPDIDAVEGQRAARIVRQAIHYEAVPFPALGVGAIVTASFGVATGLAPDMSPTTLMAEADAALYAAKHAGRDCIFPSAATALTDQAKAVA